MKASRVLTGRTLPRWLPLRGDDCARVLMYHRVVTDDCPPALRRLLSGAVTCSAFARQLDFLAARFRVVPLRELLERRDRLAGKVAITFDDGYADNCLHALPQLESRGMPATVFMISGMIEPGAGMWRDRLARAVAGLAGTGLRLDSGESMAVFPFEGDLGRQMKAAERWLGALSPAARERALAAWPGVEEDRFLDAGELRRLERGGVEIQSHTVNHPFLPDLDAAAARRELVESRLALARVLEHPVDLLAYPYGGFNSETQRLAREAGYRAAFAAGRGLLRPASDVFAIPRIGTRQGFARFRRRVGRHYRAA